MSIAQKTSKENFRLLDLSSDEQSEDLQLEIIPSRKKKISRRERSRNSTPQSPSVNVGSEVRCALVWAVRGTLVLWLLMLTWICASLYDQVSTMHTDMFKVSTSSNSFDDALQLCHTAGRELRANATKLGDRLEKLELDYQKLVKRVEKNEEFAARSAAAPELAETPGKLHTLETIVGTIGSQIAGLDSDVKTSQKHVSEALSGMQDVKTLLQRLEVKSNETAANISASSTREAQLGQNITMLNATLIERVAALERKIIELSKLGTTVAPPTAQTTVKSLNSTITTSNTTTSTTPLPIQGPPSKPNVLHTEGTN